MDLYEYQAKDLFAAHGVPVGPGQRAVTKPVVVRLDGNDAAEGRRILAARTAAELAAKEA